VKDIELDSTNKRLLGISAASRELLTRLHSAFPRPFSPQEASKCLDLPRDKTRRMLAHWAAKGWLSRIRRGVYITVPLGAANPSEWKADAWVTAATVFAPCYIGGWSAAEHWGLTEQIFNDVVVFSAADVRHKKHEIKGIKYLVRSVSPDRMNGLRPVWRDSVKVKVSSPSRTLVDVLRTPRLGGGIRHVARMIEEFALGEHRSEVDLIGELKSHGTGAASKRFGYIVETLNLDMPDILAYCLEHLTLGYSKLDPEVKHKGRLTRRWNLELNSQVAKTDDTA
jgi:predicted transcriptional regulator of viral defense system